MTGERDFFWVNVETQAAPHGTVPNGQMYVEHLHPSEATRPYPVVLIHGGGGQGLDWLGTPDGRPGWAQGLVKAGFEVYVIDRPGHGRSPYHPDLLGPMFPPPTYEFLQDIFTPATDSPPGEGHSQWPGGREPGDEAMDQFIASAGPMRADMTAAHDLEQRCLAELLDRTGPSIVFSHSAGGPAGFLAADARPEKVVALLAIEPMGPPFMERPEMGLSLKWGLAAAPLQFDPPAADPEELDTSGGRRLARLSKVPIVVVTAPHSKVGLADPATVAYLQSAGCEVSHLRLEESGLKGNGHGMMMERNSDEVLAVLVSRLETLAVA